MIPTFTRQQFTKMSFPSVRPGIWTNDIGYIWKNTPHFVTAWKALYAHFPASTLIDVVSDSEQATNLAQLSRPCRLCGRISNLCGVLEKSERRKSETETYLFCRTSHPLLPTIREGKKCFYLLWTVLIRISLIDHPPTLWGNIPWSHNHC